MDEAHNFFYAEDDAELYDSTVRLTTEAYDLLHTQVRRLVSFWRQTVHANVEHRPLILDIGAGTGEQSLNILREVEDVDLVCFDLSRSFLSALREKLTREFGDETAGGRCLCIEGDVRSPGWLTELLRQAGFGSRQVALAVSVYTLHHFTPLQKEKIYSEVCLALQPNGAFINGDLFAFDDRRLSRFAQALEEGWISDHFTEGAAGLSTLDAERLRAEWLRHIREENKPLPIEGRAPDGMREGNSELDILRRAAFSYVEVPFRFFQNGAIYAGA